jgi:DNA-binding transcriptional MerR regulator
MPVDPEETGSSTLIRSGTAARLAGVSPATLRIWEHRYGVVAPPRSPAGQRTYSMGDVQRLRLIKRLTLEGHAIGTLARLDVDELVRLSAGGTVPTGEQRVLVVGRAAARRLEDHLRPAPAFVYDELEQLEQALAQAGSADVLVIQVPTLHASLSARVLALRAGLPAPVVILVYGFGTEAAAEALRAAGVTVLREPVTGKALARLVVAARPAPVVRAGPTATTPRRYSDAELSSLRETPSRVACECPRHLAEIVTMLASFEVYSGECVARNEADAALHRHLHEVTSVARTMFEQALERVVLDEGLVV